MFNSHLIKVLSFTFVFKLLAVGIIIIPCSARASERNQVAEQECMICLSSAQELGVQQSRLTSCCHQFLCQKDAQVLEQRAQENHRVNGGERHARCPYCRHYPMKTVAAAVPAPAQYNSRPALPTPSAPAFDELPSPVEYQPSGGSADQLLQQWIDKQANAKRCPTPGCSYAFINERAQEPHTFMCPSCRCDYCSNCLIDHESDISCLVAAYQLNYLINKIDHRN